MFFVGTYLSEFFHSKKSLLLPSGCCINHSISSPQIDSFCWEILVFFGGMLNVSGNWSPTWQTKLCFTTSLEPPKLNPMASPVLFQIPSKNRVFSLKTCQLSAPKIIRCQHLSTNQKWDSTDEPTNPHLPGTTDPHRTETSSNWMFDGTQT